jgi:hypothetical protein
MLCSFLLLQGKNSKCLKIFSFSGSQRDSRKKCFFGDRDKKNKKSFQGLILKAAFMFQEYFTFGMFAKNFEVINLRSG